MGYVRPKLGHKPSDEVDSVALCDVEAETNAAIGTWEDHHNDNEVRAPKPNFIGLAAGLPGAWRGLVLPFCE